MTTAHIEIYSEAIRNISRRHSDFGRLPPEARGRIYDAEYERLCDERGLRPYTDTRAE